MVYNLSFSREKRIQTLHINLYLFRFESQNILIGLTFFVYSNINGCIFAQTIHIMKADV